MPSPPQHLPRRTTSAWQHVPALEGLRGVAVVAVVVFHLDASWLPGGYLGVDVFFVLSGFLITGLLLGELGRAGRVDLARFWHRRALRLLPALLLVILGVTALLPTMDPVDQGRRVPELLAALGHVANWQMIEAGAGYFAGFSEVSPLRHLWSLAVEGQFYLAWPLVVWLARSSRRTGVVAAAGAVASIAAMVVLHDPGATDRAYLGTDTRVHQLLIGALVAVAVDRGVHTARPVPRHAGLLPLLGIGVLFWALPGTSSLYYRGGSVVVALLAAALVLALHCGAPVAGRILSHPVLEHIGQRSYGIYLAHWPVIVLVDAGQVGFDGPALVAVQVLLSLALAELSYVLVEQPIRRGTVWGPPSPRRTAWLAGGALSAAAGAVLLAGAGREPAPSWAEEAGTTQISVREAAAPAPVEAETLIHRAALLGDSVAWSLASDLATAAEAEGIDFGIATVIGCPMGPGPAYDDDGTPRSDNDTCAASVPDAHAAVRAMQPDVVIWHDLNSMFARRAADGTLLRSGPEWEQSVFASWDLALAALRGPETEVVMVVPSLRAQSPAGACEQDRDPGRCADIQGQDERIRAATRRYVAERGEPWLHAVDVDDLVCPALPCPAVVDGIQIRGGGTDLTHYTEEGARWLAPQLFERVLAAVTSR